MSQRHRSQEMAPPPKMDLRAHAHNERHRINSELQLVADQVSAGIAPDEVHEPGRAWVPEHHHHDRPSGRTRNLRHWKVKAWKRRTAQRRAKAKAFRLAAENS